jgi:hypothetical protein
MRVGEGKVSGRHPLFGQILLKQSKITVEQLDEALEKQAGTRKYIGEVLVEMGAIEPGDIEKALEIQRNYYPEDGGP